MVMVIPMLMLMVWYGIVNRDGMGIGAGEISTIYLDAQVYYL